MHLKSVIEQLGYTPQETAVYLAALELGGSTATDIAAKARLPRTTVNLIINSLNKKGLMNAFIQRKRKIWAAENPERLMITVKEREAALTAALPALRLRVRREIAVPHERERHALAPCDVGDRLAVLAGRHLNAGVDLLLLGVRGFAEKAAHRKADQ